MNSKRRQFLWDCFGSLCFFVIVAALITLGLRACRGGDDDLLKPIPQIHWPKLPVLTEPVTPPDPIRVSELQDIDTLKPDEWLVVESDVELFVRRFPEGIIAVDATTGPIRVRGKFADGTGKVETRVFRTAFVYFLTSEKAGVVGIDLIPVGVTAETDIARHVLTVSDGTKPNPPPKPEPGPSPVDPVVPVVPGKLQVLVIEDTTKTTAQQAAILDSAAMRNYLAGHCSSEGGSRDYLKISQLQDVADQEQWVKTAFAKPRSSLPFIVIMSPTKETSGPLPASIDETLKILKQLGGE